MHGKSAQKPHASTPVGGDRSVTVVLNVYNDTTFLREALASILAQTEPADEVFVVDDGSDESPAALLAEFPKVKLFRKGNGGLASARNFGLLRAHTRYITFLDADDRYESHALASGLACFMEHPDAAMVYAGHRRIGVRGEPLGRDHFRPVGGDVYADLLRGNFIGMHATVLYRRDVLVALGGFDETLRLCEDYELYLRLARRYPIAGHPEIVAEYRQHGRNLSHNNGPMLAAVLDVHGRHGAQVERSRRQAWHAGQAMLRAHYDAGRSLQGNSRNTRGVVKQFFARVGRSIVWRLRRRLRGGRIHRFINRRRGKWPPPVGSVRFGDFQSTAPLSVDFGYDRGTPVDRHYIESWLASRASDIQGHVLEVAEDTYSTRFGGGKITKQDVLHLNLPDPPVTILGDLTQPGVLPDNTFDCIILTQTLQMIFNLEDAVTRMHAALKPGGVLLLTVPGITQLEKGEWGDAWCWSFTHVSIRKLFGRSFGDEALDITTYGNCYAAVTYLYGAALEEIDQKKLEPTDMAYPVIVALRAQKR